jgi:hypothetical protein
MEVKGRKKFFYPVKILFIKKKGKAPKGLSLA